MHACISMVYEGGGGGGRDLPCTPHDIELQHLNINPPIYISPTELAVMPEVVKAIEEIDWL